MKEEQRLYIHNVHLNYEMSVVYQKILEAILQMTENETLTRNELYEMLVNIAADIQERIGEAVIIGPGVDNKKCGCPISP